MAPNLPTMLDELRQHLLHLSSHVEEGIAKVTSALVNRDSRLARDVVAADSHIDQLEVQVEAECERILVLQGPVACDMRFVVTTIKINNYLERMGDLTKKIGKNVVYLCGVPPTAADVDFREIAQKARSMVRRAMDSFVNYDVNAARLVIADDDEVDALKGTLYEQLLSTMQEHPDQLRALLKLYSVARNYERMGDMATHVAEEVVFLVEGDIVRHSGGNGERV